MRTDQLRLSKYQQLNIQIELQTTDGILMEPSGLNVWDISETQCSPRPNLLSMTKMFLTPCGSIYSGGGWRLRPESTLAIACFYAFKKNCTRLA